MHYKKYGNSDPQPTKIAPFLGILIVMLGPVLGIYLLFRAPNEILIICWKTFWQALRYLGG